MRTACGLLSAMPRLALGAMPLELPPRRGFSFRSASRRGGLIGVICALACWLLSGTSWIQRLDNWEFDASFVHRGPRASAANIVIVAIDDASLAEIEKPVTFLSPELAKVVTYLHDQGAAAIGVDFLLPRTKRTMKYLLPGQPGDAERMGIAVAQAGNVVLPEWFLGNERPQERPPYEWYSSKLPSRLAWADLGFVDFNVDADSRAAPGTPQAGRPGKGQAR